MRDSDLLSCSAESYLIVGELGEGFIPNDGLSPQCRAKQVVSSSYIFRDLWDVKPQGETIRVRHQKSMIYILAIAL
jgi:hypothetical protein